MSKSVQRAPRLMPTAKEDKKFKSRFDLDKVSKQLGNLDYREVRKIMVEG